MDGVLIDSEPAHKLAKKRAFARFGITVPEGVYEEYKGRPDETMINGVVASISEANIDAQELLRLKHLEFEAVEDLAVPIQGAKEFVNWAKSKFRIALATSATPRNRRTALLLLGLNKGRGFSRSVELLGARRGSGQSRLRRCGLRRALPHLYRRFP